MSSMTVTKLARAVGTSPDTVRYYERLGLLPDAARTDAGYRVFGDRDVERMRFIRSAQRLGFSLAEIGELLGIREHGLCPCGRARERLAAKLPEIEAKLAALEELRQAVRNALEQADGTGRCWSCPPQLIQITARPEEESDG
jgi:DNA-binding transcriptional MerR regulator